MKFSEFMNSDINENFDVADVPETSDLNAKFMEVERRFAAARKALGIANRLPSPEDRRKHKSRIMGMLNQLRAAIADIQRELGDDKDQYSNLDM